MADEIHVNDIGTRFRATIKDGSGVVDISASSVRKMKFQKPDASVIERAAAMTGTGTDGQMHYDTVLNDLDQEGTWRVQGYVEIGSGKWHSDLHTFIVSANLS